MEIVWLYEWQSFGFLGIWSKHLRSRTLSSETTLFFRPKSILLDLFKYFLSNCFTFSNESVVDICLESSLMSIFDSLAKLLVSSSSDFLFVGITIEMHFFILQILTNEIWDDCCLRLIPTYWPLFAMYWLKH